MAGVRPGYPGVTAITADPMDQDPTPFDYMTGGCHVFALAAQALTGWKMVAVMCAGRRKGEASLRGCHDIVHVYLVDPNGDRFDAFGRGTSGGEYEYEKEIELGERVTTVDCDAALVAKMVRIGWLSPFEESEVEVAKRLAETVIADEYEAEAPRP